MRVPTTLPSKSWQEGVPIPSRSQWRDLHDLGGPQLRSRHGNLQALGLGEACRKAAAGPAGRLLRCRGGTTSPCFSPIPTAASIRPWGTPTTQQTIVKGKLCRLWGLEKRVGRQQQARRVSYCDSVGNNIALFIADPNGGIYTALGDPNYAADQVDHGITFAGFGPWRSVSEGSSKPGATSYCECRGGTTSPCFSPIPTAASIRPWGTPTTQQTM